jgi:ABC-2 type transport system permease protein
MNLWRLEWLRLVRTRRLLAILAVYLFFGFTGPLTARYLSQIINRLGSRGVKVEFPTPRPADGIAQFTSNTAQIGLLVVVLVAASALAFDAHVEMAVFLRTRVRGVGDILLPAYVLSTAAAVAGLLAGSLAAWYETAVLLGPLPVWRMAFGIGCGALFLAFAIALTAMTAALANGTLATGGTALLFLLGMAIVGSLGDLGRWLPTSLLTAMAELVDHTQPAAYVPAVIVTSVATAAALAGATALAARREL